MLAKDSVQRASTRGLSFTEFSYMLLQAADFLHLYRELGVELQMGGADQWGNITAGLELIRRVEGRPARRRGARPRAGYPLLLDAVGAKFGKTEGGTPSGSTRRGPRRTRSTSSGSTAGRRDVGKLPAAVHAAGPAEIEALEADGGGRTPSAGVAQRALALDLTARVHGGEVAERVEEVSEAVFSRRPPDPRDGVARVRVRAARRTRSSGPRRCGRADRGRGRGRVLRLEQRGPAGDQPGRLSINEQRLAGVEAPVPARSAGATCPAQREEDVPGRPVEPA